MVSEKDTLDVSLKVNDSVSVETRVKLGDSVKKLSDCDRERVGGMVRVIELDNDFDALGETDGVIVELSVGANDSVKLIRIDGEEDSENDREGDDERDTDLEWDVVRDHERLSVIDSETV